MWIKGIKLSLIAIFFNYYCSPLLLGRLIPNLTIVCYGIMLVCFLIDNGAEIEICSEIRIWIMYLLVCFFLMLFQPNKEWVTRSLIEFAQHIFLCYIVAYICIREKSVTFIAGFLSALAFILIILILRRTTDFSMRIGYGGTATAALSTNDVGALFAFSCATVIVFFLSIRSHASGFAGIVGVIASVLFFIGIMLSGSRKAAYAVLILYVLIVLLCARRMWNNLNTGTFFFSVIILILFGVFLIQVLIPLFERSSLYQREFGRVAQHAEDSNTARVWLIESALRDFADYPLTGLGFNNFMMAHGAYTHNTYVEPLASSGIFGFLYIIPYLSVLKKQFELCKAEPSEEYRQRIVFSFYIMFLFVGIGIPYIYKDIPTLIFGFFLGSQGIAFSEMEDSGYEPKDTRVTSSSQYEKRWGTKGCIGSNAGNRTKRSQV